MVQVLVSLTPGEIVGAGLTWLVWPGISGSRKNSVPPVNHRGQGWPAWLDQGCPDPLGPEYPPKLRECSCRRSKRVQGGVLFDCAGFKASPVITHDRWVPWKGWTACPLTVSVSETVGGQRVRSVDGTLGPIMPELSFLNSSIGCLALSRLTEIGWNRVKSSQPTGFTPVVLYFEHLVHLIRGPCVVFWCLLNTRRSGLHHTKKRWTHP